MSKKKLTFIDLFAGCGGLEDGFLQTGKYIDVDLKKNFGIDFKELWGLKD